MSGWFVRPAAAGVAGLGLALWACACDAPAEAGFLQPPGTSQIITVATLGGFDAAFDNAGRLRRAARFAKGAVDTHVSHGWSDKVTLLAQISSESLSPMIVNGGGDYAATLGLVGARWRLATAGETLISLQPMVGYGTSSAGRGAAFDLRVVMGRGLRLADRPAFVEAQIGYRHGLPGQAREWRADVSFGWRPADRWLLLSQLFLAHGLCGKPGMGRSRAKAQVSVVHEVTASWAVQVGFFTTLAGRQTAMESGFVAGIWRQF